MTHRYSLRFESGERTGEQVSISGTTFTVGRASGNDLQIVESSVSGRHAELLLDRGSVLLRDLGSTNGTRAGGERVIEVELRHGQGVTFGNVTLTFLDASAPEDAGARPSSAGDRARVSDENLARSRRGGRGAKLGLAAFLVLLAVGVGTWWWFGRGGGPRGERLRPVPEVPGNLLARGFSFEGVPAARGDSSSWEAAEGSLGTFLASARARRSGRRGLGVALAAGEHALHRSAPLAVRSDDALTARAALRASGTAFARLGLELSASGADEEGGEGPGATLLWGPAVAPEEEWREVELAATVPGGYDTARVLLLAELTAGSGSAEEASGRVEADDVSLVPGTGAPAATLDEHRFYTGGDSLVLFKVDRVLLSDLRLRPPDAPGRAGVPLALTAEETGVLLAGGGGTLTLRVEAPALATGLATLGEAGYVRRGADFDEEGITDLLIGTGADLVRLAFGAPLRIRAQATGSGTRLTVDLGADASVRIQVRFQVERQRTVDLAREAVSAERDGRLGESLSLWKRLLAEVPVEASEIERAEMARARLLQAGFEEVRHLESEIVRARFFRLVDLYRLCRSRAEEIGARYVDSEVEEGALALAAEIDADLAELVVDLDRHEVARLEAILAALEAQEATELAAEVRRTLETRYGKVQ